MKKLIAVLIAAALLFGTSKVASANHSWGGYHWARTSSLFTLMLGDNVSSIWDSYLATSSNEWSAPTGSATQVLKTTIVPGLAGRNCKPTSGRVEVCNRTYGNNGWLGLAQIWVSGLHITQGVTKMNDTYFNTSTYNSPAWRQFVMCQEIGHTFGLDHQDTTFNNANLGTCMDYTNDPDGSLYKQLSNEQPNQHDYDELDTIYAHLDSFTTVGQTIGQIAKQAAAQNLDNPGEWGRLVRDNGKVAVFERDFGLGFKLFTFVIWAN